MLKKSKVLFSKSPYLTICILVLTLGWIYWTFLYHPSYQATQVVLNLDNSYSKHMDEWPKPNRKRLDPEIEARIDALIDNMTLPEKIGQMTQGEIANVSPNDAQEYALGSVLNEGGSRPGYLYGPISDWIKKADSYWLASLKTSNKIPIMWGTDAVHGHNGVHGMTLFPHNIGLGSTGDAQLIRKIGQATASQVRATGLDWTFAPTVAVVKNTRWGRSYESYGQDPELVYHLSKAMVSGLQYNLTSDGILATAKHFIADGAVKNGNDQGSAFISEEELINTHAMGYYAALEADVQIVMASFSSWWQTKLHEDHYLLSEVLKKKMGFDGFVISDYNAIGQIKGCFVDSCPAAINAGIDMVMVPRRWKTFISNTVAQVENGEIAVSRIDDAVRRILRVKMRAGLFEQVQPSLRENAGLTNLASSGEIKALARQAVRQSLVLLKNNEHLLPLSKSEKYLVINGDRISRQAGGWSLNWQGNGMYNEFFPEGQTILSGIKSLVEPHGGEIFTSYNWAMQNNVTTAIVVLSERTYAEGSGDIQAWLGTSFELQLLSNGAKALKTLRVRQPDLPIVVIYLGGRPLWMNQQINESSSFVVAWLPGTEGGGVADGLFGESAINGRLTVNWPATDCTGSPSTSNALFPVGYGLTFDDTLQIENNLPSKASTTWGTRNFAPGCLISNVFISPFD